MFRCFKLLFILCFFSFFFSETSLQASDVVVVLDTSGSLLSYYDDINDKILVEICTNYVKKGDVFHLISFNTSPYLEISQIVDSELSFSNIVSKFLFSYPLAKASDILLTLDFLKSYLRSLPRLHEKIVIFISDGLFTCSDEYSNKYKEFETELNNFSDYLVRMGRIQTYYIRLPIISNKIVLDLKNDLSVFAKSNFEMEEIEAYPLISNLPSSLKEYLSFDEIGKKVFRNINVEAFSDALPVSIEAESAKENEEMKSVALKAFEKATKKEAIKTIYDEATIAKHEIENRENNSLDEKKELNAFAAKSVQFDVDEKKDVELKRRVLEPETPIRETTTKKEKAMTKLDEEVLISDVNQTIEKENSNLFFSSYRAYIFLIVGLLIILVLFFVIKNYLKRYESEEKTLSNEDEKRSNLVIAFSTANEDANSKVENVKSKNEILLYSAQEYLDTSEDGLKSSNNNNDDSLKEETKGENLPVALEESLKETEDGKIIKEKQGSSKVPSSEERILLNVKTLENRSDIKYSPTFFTLSSDTKKAFAKNTAIENMVSLLNASYVDSGDVFYRFKRSLYTKIYVKNIDVTKQNYLEMFVLNQRRSIGMRNVHFLTQNKTFYLGGSNRDDFLIFLVSIPRHLASIHYDGKEIIFTILEPRYFPYEKEIKIKNPIDRFFVIKSDKNYSIHFMFRLYEKENLSALSRSSIKS